MGTMSKDTVKTTVSVYEQVTNIGEFFREIHNTHIQALGKIQESCYQNRDYHSKYETHEILSIITNIKNGDYYIKVSPLTDQGFNGALANGKADIYYIDEKKKAFVKSSVNRKQRWEDVYASFNNQKYYVKEPSKKYKIY